MKMLFDDGDPFGDVDIPEGSSLEEASLIGSYWHAVADFLGADPSDPDYADKVEKLHDFDDFEINGRFALTDEDFLEELAAEGEIAFDDLYEEW